MTKRRWIVLGIAIVLVLAAGGGALWWFRLRPTPPPTEPALAQPVAIAVPEAPAEVTLGVVVTLSSKPGEGSDWKYAAEGAQVAAQRLSMGGVRVHLETVDDKGSVDGARRAVEQLADQGVFGIVAASQGSHLRGAVEAAKEARLPLLLPYEPDPELVGKPVWATGPLTSTIGFALQESLTAAELKRPLLIDVGGGAPDSVKLSDKLGFAPGDDTENLIKDVTAHLNGKEAEGKKADSILISGPADQQAAVVRALQGAEVTVPIFLTPDATSPAFAAALVEAGGSLSTSLATVGPNSDDAAALGSGESGKAMSAFLAATRMLAGDADTKTLLGDRPFGEVVGTADARSHDAVIALVRAAAATEANPGTDRVTALAGIQLDHSGGLAGPGLDFSSQAALAPDSVVALRSSDQDLGLRPAADEASPRLIWFAAP